MAAKKPVLALAGVPRVNLMPRAEMERRERLSLTRTWALLAVAALAVGALVIAGAFTLKVLADQRLAAEQATTDGLLSDLSGYSDVSTAIATRGELESFRADAMATDAAWTPMLGKITGALPKGVALVEFTLSPGTPPVSDDPTAGVGYNGVLTLGSADAKVQAVTVAALRQVEGIRSVDAGTLYQGGEAGFEFTIAVAFDQSVYSGQYAKEAGK